MKIVLQILTLLQSIGGQLVNNDSRKNSQIGPVQEAWSLERYYSISLLASYGRITMNLIIGFPNGGIGRAEVTYGMTGELQYPSLQKKENCVKRYSLTRFTALIILQV